MRGALFCPADGKSDQIARLKKNLEPARVGTCEVTCLWLVLSVRTGQPPSPSRKTTAVNAYEGLHIVNASWAFVTLSEA